ncbi:hypothetical protein ACP4OV_009556 [Aristida adscensionis]
MPLGQRPGDKSDSRYCGVEVLDIPAGAGDGDGLPAVLHHSLSSGFDFVLAPLVSGLLLPGAARRPPPPASSDVVLCSAAQVDPSYRPAPGAVLPVVASDLVLGPAQWSSHVVGKLSEWIDLDADDERLRLDSELTLKQEIAWAAHLSLQACVLPTPRRSSCGNYARVVNQILQGSNNMQLPLEKSEQPWLPQEKSEPMDGDHDDESEMVDSWEWWNSFRLLCEHSSQLAVVLDISSSLPSINSLVRWFGEPVRAVVLQTNAFLTNSKGYPCLSKRHQKLLTGFFNHSVQVILSGRSKLNVSQVAEGVLSCDENHTEDTRIRHALSPYLEYIAYLYQRMDPLSEQERFEINYRDFLQSPLQLLEFANASSCAGNEEQLLCTLHFLMTFLLLQPLMDNLEAQTYETFEKDVVKYSQYQRAVAKALVDRVPDDEVSTTRTVLMVVGAGRGPLVRASLQAAEETGRKLKVYAVEKNPNAVITLHSLIKLEGWEGLITIISSDMRCWDAPEKADILVSELLGSFGDNELSPECLDGAQRFLKPDGISIPSSYTSFIQPITASKLHNDIKAHKDIAHFETAYVVKLHRIATLAPTQPVFTFTHPNYSPNASNQRYIKLQFEMPEETGSCLVHGFAGYFDAVLYKDVHLGIEPNTATPNMFSWFPIFFPLRKPIYVPSGSPIEVHFWRCCAPTKVWYEWTVTTPSPSPIHNSNGRSYWVGL